MFGSISGIKPKSRKQQTEGKATGLALIGAVSTTIANFGVALLVAKAGAGFAGIFFMATAVISILGNGSCLVAMTGLVYFMPQALSEDNRPKNVKPLLMIALKPVFLVSGVLGFFVYIFSGSIAGLISDEFFVEFASILKVSAMAIPAWAVTTVLLGATRGLGSMTPTVAINQIFKPLIQILLLLLVFIFRDEPSAWLVGLAWSAPIVVGSFAAAGAVVFQGGLTQDSDSSLAVSSNEFWSYTRPRAISSALQIALERLDVILVGALASAGAAGIYGAVTRYVTAGNYLIFSVAQATTPPLRRSIKSDNYKSAASLLKKVTGWIVLLTWPYFLILATKAEPLANMLDPLYSSGASALAILAIGMTVSGFVGPIDATLLMIGKSKLSLLGVFGALVIDVALAWLLVPQYGLIGAALAWAAAVGFQNVFAAYNVYKHSGLSSFSQGSVLAAVGSVLAVVPIGMLASNNFVGLIITCLCAGPIYLVWVWNFRKILQIPIIGK